LVDAVEAVVGVIGQYYDLTAGTIPAQGFGLMTAWTILLIWADRKPVERRIVLGLTIIPIAANVTKTWILFLSSVISFSDQAVNIIGAPIVLALYIIAYFLARQQAKSQQK